jgi:hypothetical protein
MLDKAALGKTTLIFPLFSSSSPSISTLWRTVRHYSYPTQIIWASIQIAEAATLCRIHTRRRRLVCTWGTYTSSQSSIQQSVHACELVRY